ncbi:MAG: toast rack family protein [Chloroflexi bacterium]|nr:toast rack family protein [Chloroflexota bacterium]
MSAISSAISGRFSWLIVGFFARNQLVEGKQVSIPLEGATSAYVKLDHGAGRLTLRSGAGSGEIVNGTFGNGLSYKSHVEGGRMEVKLRTSQQAWAWWPGESLDWDIRLNRDIPLSLKIDSGASASILDLSDLKVTDLDIDTGASSTELTLPANAGNTHVDIDTGASSLKVSIPSGVAASIRVKSGIASVNVNPRFSRLDGGLYQSTDYSTAANRVDMTIDAGVGSIEVN